MDRRRRGPAIRHQRAELRPLQNLRHQGSEPEYYLGSARGRGGAELPEYVSGRNRPAATNKPHCEPSACAPERRPSLRRQRKKAILGSSRSAKGALRRPMEIFKRERVEPDQARRSGGYRFRHPDAAGPSRRPGTDQAGPRAHLAVRQLSRRAPCQSAARRRRGLDLLPGGFAGRPEESGIARPRVHRFARRRRYRGSRAPGRARAAGLQERPHRPPRARRARDQDQAMAGRAHQPRRNPCADR